MGRNGKSQGRMATGEERRALDAAGLMRNTCAQLCVSGFPFCYFTSCLKQWWQLGERGENAHASALCL